MGRQFGWLVSDTQSVSSSSGAGHACRLLTPKSHHKCQHQQYHHSATSLDLCTADRLLKTCIHTLAIMVLSSTSVSVPQRVLSSGPQHIQAFTCGSRPPARRRHRQLVAAARPAECSLEVSRRQLWQAGCAAVLLQLNVAGTARAQEPAALATSSNAAALEPYVNGPQQYRLSIPAGWEKKDKAGADVLFEDPARRSTSVGVTVSPVRIASIEQFGDLATVGQRLLEAEGKKESTLDVQLLASSSRKGSAGATLYDYEYELNSTRGIKRIFNTVTITGSKLYILNGNLKCDKEAGCAASEGTLSVLRDIAASFDAGSQS